MFDRPRVIWDNSISPDGVVSAISGVDNQHYILCGNNNTTVQSHLPGN